MTTDISSNGCEGALRYHKQNNIELNLWPSHNRIIDRMLDRRLELREAYKDVYQAFAGNEIGLQVFFDALICCANGWHPEAVAKSRDGRAELIRLNEKIAKAATELADLLDESDEVQEDSGFITDAYYDICQITEEAGAHNSWFNHSVKEKLEGLRCQYDGKYWPIMSDFIRVIADTAENASVQPSNPTTAAATTGPRASRTDFFKAFFDRLEDEAESHRGSFPGELKLADATIAALSTCALDLEPEASPEYVKGVRHRLRKEAAAKR